MEQKMKYLFLNLCIALLSLPSALATLSTATPRDNLALKRGQQLFSRVCKAETTPV